jgi:hypothetical protein
VRKRLFEIGLVTATIGVLPATVLVLWTCGWYAGVTAPRDADTRLREREGVVRWVDIHPAADTLHLGADRSGAEAMAVALTPHTLILVGDKEGGVRDLRKGTRIRILYQRREASLVALCVEFVNGAGDASRSRGCRDTTVLDRLPPGSG